MTEGTVLSRCRREGEACKKDDLMENRISALPDELVGNILSLLTMKEAVRTCVLSRRWENLWKYFTGNLDFDGSRAMARMAEAMETMSLTVGRTKYVNWVHQVLNLYQGQDIDEFRVCFDLDKNYAYVIDGWIDFAVEKGVRRLELDLREYSHAYRVGRSYTIPLSLLHDSSLSRLTALCLRKVDMTDEVLALFLSSSPLIEELSLVDSHVLVNVEIAGALKLKRLELTLCQSLQNVKISAMNLVSFEYYGPAIKNPFENVPRLSEVSIGGSYSMHVVHAPSVYFSRELYQLETLILDLDFMVYDRSWFSRPTFPEFQNLKYLEMQVSAYADQSILCLCYLIDAAPCLHKLVLKLRYSSSSQLRRTEPETEELAGWRAGKPRDEGRSRRFECLKVVEIAGWIGNTSDTELAVNLLENAVSLDKMMIDPSYPSRNFQRSWVHKSWKAYRNDLAGPRERAKQLEAKLPPGTELVIC